MAKLKITQVRSSKGSDGRQLGALRTLRLGKIGRSAEHEDHSTVRGLIRTVDHLVEHEEVKG